MLIHEGLEEAADWEMKVTVSDTTLKTGFRGVKEKSEARPKA